MSDVSANLGTEVDALLDSLNSLRSSDAQDPKRLSVEKEAEKVRQEFIVRLRTLLATTNRKVDQLTNMATEVSPEDAHMELDALRRYMSRMKPKKPVRELLKLLLNAGLNGVVSQNSINAVIRTAPYTVDHYQRKQAVKDARAFLQKSGTRLIIYSYKKPVVEGRGQDILGISLHWKNEESGHED